MCGERRGRGGEEVGSGPLLLPWQPHPDAAAAVGARVCVSVCWGAGGGQVKLRGAPQTQTTATSD